MMAVGTAGVLLMAFIATLNGFAQPTRSFNLDHPMISMDGVTHFLNAIVLLSAMMTVLVSNRFLARIGANHGEYYALILASVLGMMLLAASTDLLMLFLSLELMSIPVYVLAGFQRGSLRSNESALKYFVIGSFASGVLLYGCALLYGATGTLSLVGIAGAFDPESPLALLGAALLLIGLGFKIASVPFHQWAPDVYEGAPTTVTGLMATAVKVAAFGALMRVLSLALEPGTALIYDVLWWMALLSMTVGNVMALVQTSAKRMLAYSSVSHAGYLLVGLCAGGASGYSAVLFYLLVYTFMSLAAFTVLAVLQRGQDDRERIDDLAGLSIERPFLAATMALSMFALAGIPGTGGFIGKWQLFAAAIERGSTIGDTSLVWLAIFAVLNSAISLGYYLHVIRVMYMRDRSEPLGDHGASGPLERVVLVSCFAAILLLGIFPSNVFVIFLDIDVLAGAASAVASLGL
jgi:NADH-quinone oxidoreductase subunit N